LDKAEYYGLGLSLSINTADEEESRQALKRMRESNSVQSFTQNQSKKSSNKGAQASSVSTECTSGPISTDMSTLVATTPQDEPEITLLSTHRPNLPTLTQSTSAVSQRVTDLGSSTQADQPLTQADLQRAVALFNERMRAMSEQMDQRLRIAVETDPKFEFNGCNLVTIGGKNPAKWALKAVDVLFTKEELRKCVLEETNRTKRECLDQDRVQLMKREMVARFTYLQNDPGKIENAWTIVKERVNNKGRNLIYRLAQSIKLRNNEANNA